jgi:hypothetical protein
MEAYFVIGKKFKVLKKNDDGTTEEIKEPVIIEYVTRGATRGRLKVQVEIDKGEVQRIVTIQSKEAIRENKNPDDKGRKRSMFKNL